MISPRDWAQFIRGILDGSYALDIKKTGSVAMFVKNQLAANSRFYTNSGLFSNALEDEWKRMEITADDCLQNPSVYQKMLELGSYFLFSNDVFLTSVCSLHVQLDSVQGLPFKVEEERKRMLLQCNHVLVTFIEQWKRKFGVLRKMDLLTMKPYMDVVVDNWKREIDDKWMEDHYPLFGLIYLDKWQTIEPERRASFIKTNGTSRPLIRALITDVELKKSEPVFVFFPLGADLIRHQQQLLQVFENRGLLLYIWEPTERGLSDLYETHLNNIRPSYTSSSTDLMQEVDRVSLN
jgi:hypothetical protein